MLLEVLVILLTAVETALTKTVIWPVDTYWTLKMVTEIAIAKSRKRGDLGEPKSGKINGSCQPPPWQNLNDVCLFLEVLYIPVVQFGEVILYAV